MTVMKRALIYFLAGGCSFWGPTILYSCLFQLWSIQKAPLLDFVFLNFVPLLLLMFAYIAIYGKQKDSAGYSVAICMLLGVYFLAPLLIFIESLAGGFVGASF